MTAPTSMPVMPAVARSSSPASSSAAASDGSPAFANALDDALSGGGATGTTTGSTTGGTPDSDAEQPEAVGTEDAAAPALPVVLVPGLWALMTAVNPLTAAATGTATTTAAASLIGAVTGTPVPTATVVAPAALAGVATDPAAPPALPAVPDLTVPPAPAAADPATVSASALAEAAGLSVVVDTAPTPSTGTQTTLAADPGATATVGAPLLPPAGAAGSADAGSDGSAEGTAAAPLPADEAQPAADTDSVFGLGGTTQTSATTPAAEITQSAPPVDDAPVATQLGRQIAVLRNAPDGSQTMTLVITPESLGPVTIAVTVTAGTLDLTLQGSTEHGRHALLDALPDLRRDLEGAGLSFSKLEVGTSTDAGARSAQQQLLDARAGQQSSSGQPGQQGPRAWGSATDPVAADGTPLTTDLSTSAGVDVRV